MKNNKETSDQSLSGNCCTNSAGAGTVTVTGTVTGTTSNTMYYSQVVNGKIKTKTRTVDVYKINKKGKEVLVGRNVITTTKTTYPKNNIVSNPNYTLTTSSSDKVATYPASAALTYTASAKLRI